MDLWLSWPVLPKEAKAGLFTCWKSTRLRQRTMSLTVGIWA